MATPKERANYYVVDKRGEGGLVSEFDRVAMADQPTLFIGLGGTGTDALLHAKYVMRRKLKFPAGKKQPGRLSFLAIDTDTNDLKNKQVGGVHLDEAELCNITEPNLAGYMHDTKTIPQPYQRDWLCNGIKADFIDFGAGGIRQCGRFMMMMKSTEIADRIQTKVNAVWGAGKENGSGFDTVKDAVNIYILTGIAGGTGSGTFLDIAYLAKHVVTNMCHRKARVRGIIFMPDVNECKVKDPAVKAYLPVNGYAALKELDFWMNAERGRSFKQQYNAMISIDTPEKPFDLCFLVSPNGALEEDYTTCMQTTGEALLNIVSAPADNKGADGNAQSFESYVVNLVSLLPNVKKNYAGNYIFASMGMDERRLQMDQMANYIAYYVLGRVNEMFDREPTEAEVVDCFKKLKLDARRGMRDLFDRTLPNRPFESRVRDLDSLKAAIARYKHGDVLYQDVLEEELKAWVTQSESVFGQRKAEVRTEIMVALRERIEKYFVDLKYGPYYAHRMLHNIAVGKKDIIDRLQEEWDAIRAFLLTADDMTDNLSRLCAEKKRKACSNQFVPGIGGKYYNEYVEAAFKLYDHIRYTKLAVILNSLYGQLVEDAVQYNNLIVERFATLLEELAKVFRANSDIMAKVDTDGNTHSWNIGNFAKIKALVDEAFHQMEAGGDTEKLVTEFLELLLEDRDQWVGDRGDLGESFSRFVSDKFKNLMQESLEESYMRMHDLNTESELEDYIRTNVLPQLETGARVMYTTEDGLSSLSNAPRLAMISYPAKANHIGNAVDQYTKARNIPCNIIQSQRTGSLFWFESHFGLPLYAHSSMALMQHAYDVYGENDKHLGRQLKMGDGENWLKLLPPLMPEAVWEAKKYANRPVAERNAKSRELMIDAWRNHRGTLVQQMPGAGDTSVFVLGKVDAAAYRQLIESAPLTPDEQARLRAEGVSAATTMHKDAGAIQAFVDRAAAFADTAWTPSNERFKDDVFNLLMNGVTVATVKDNPDLRTEQLLSENLLLTPDLSDKLAEQYALRGQLLEIIDTHRTFLQLGDQETAQRQLFANAWMYGLYRKVVPKVYQLDVTNTGMQTFVLMSITDYKLAPVEDKYYAMFQKFIALPEAQRQVIQKIVELRETQLAREMGNGVMDTYIGYVQALTTVDAEIEKRLAAIDMDISFDRPEIRQFYVKLREIFAYWLREE